MCFAATVQLKINCTGESLKFRLQPCSYKLMVWQIMCQKLYNTDNFTAHTAADTRYLQTCIRVKLLYTVRLISLISLSTHTTKQILLINFHKYI